ncbi:MAG: hypothetical protein M1153_01610 [Patescibacteria group bacterium]|nr:hypothetical protein [Patescibacteria group bacterium]
MLKDWNHDLVHQLSEISDSLWRMQDYKKAANSCPHCLALWSKLENEYEGHIKLLAEEIKRHVAEERFD